MIGSDYFLKANFEGFGSHHNHDFRFDLCKTILVWILDSVIKKYWNWKLNIWWGPEGSSPEGLFCFSVQPTVKISAFKQAKESGVH